MVWLHQRKLTPGLINPTSPLGVEWFRVSHLYSTPFFPFGEGFTPPPYPLPMGLQGGWSRVARRRAKKDIDQKDERFAREVLKKLAFRWSLGANQINHIDQGAFHSRRLQNMGVSLVVGSDGGPGGGFPLVAGTLHFRSKINVSLEIFKNGATQKVHPHQKRAFRSRCLQKMEGCKPTRFHAIDQNERFARDVFQKWKGDVSDHCSWKATSLR